MSFLDAKMVLENWIQKNPNVMYFEPSFILQEYNSIDRQAAVISLQEEKKVICVYKVCHPDTSEILSTEFEDINQIPSCYSKYEVFSLFKVNR